MQVDILHRKHLRVPAAGCAALDPEHRAERRLTECNRRILAKLGERLSKTDGRDGLSLAQRRWCHACHEHDCGVGRLVASDSLAGVVRDLGRVFAEQL
jgi:hypothetical protein